MSVAGFTGTREPPEDWADRIDDLVDALPPGTVVVVGCCVGVDARVANRARARRLWVHAVVPGIGGRWLDPEWRRHCSTFECMPIGTTYRQRDERIVDLVAMHGGRLVGVPRWPEDDPRSLRSGSWMTCNIARRRGVPLHVERLWLPAETRA